MKRAAIVTVITVLGISAPWSFGQTKPAQTPPAGPGLPQRSSRRKASATGEDATGV